MQVLNSYLITLVFLLFPTLTLVHGKTPGIAIHIFAVLGILFFVIQSIKAKDSIKKFIQNYWLICLITFMPLAYNVTLSLLQTGTTSFPSSLQRLALFSFALFLLLNLKNLNKVGIQLGILIACVASMIVMLIESNYGAYRPNVQVHNLLNYTNFIVLLGVFSLFLIKLPLTKHFKTEIAIKLLCFVCVAVAVFLSKSKGPVISFFVLTVLFIYIQTKGISLIKKTAILLITILIPILIINSNNDLKKRMLDAFEVTTSIGGSEKERKKAGDQSSRIRLNLWRASYMMFQENPWYGNGKQTFSEQLISLNQRGKINNEATWRSKTEGFMQPHNDMANMAATRGVPGIIMLLLLYLVPIRYYQKQKNKSDTIDTLSNLGIFLNLGFILFGLTVSTFTTGWMTAIFALMHCTTISLIHNEKLKINHDK